MQRQSLGLRDLLCADAALNRDRLRCQRVSCSATALDVELLVAPIASRLSPALPAGEQLLEANLYAVCDLVAGRAARASSARQYRAIYTRFCHALRDELDRPPVVADVTADAIAAYSRAPRMAVPAASTTDGKYPAGQALPGSGMSSARGCPMDRAT